MKKVLYSLVLLFIFLLPFNVGAISYQITDYYMDITPLSNGDVKFKELLMIRGDYNGYIRDINFSGNFDYTVGDTTEGKSALYSGSSIYGIKVYDLTSAKKNGFDTIYSTEYRNIKYEKIPLLDGTGISLKMYNASDGGTKAFYIEYIVENLIVAHNDIAEFYFPLVASNFEDNIKNMQVRFNLPGTSEIIRGWGHGIYNGSLTIDSASKKVDINVGELAANTPIDIRILFDKELVSVANRKMSKIDAFDQILKIEQKRSDDANALRDELAKEEAQRQLVANIFVGVFAFWLLGLIGIVIFVYLKYDKEHKSSFEHDYYRDFPREYGPEVLEYLLKETITSNSLSASMLEVIRKKALVLSSDINDKTNYTFKRGEPKEALTNAEEFLVDWFINDIGNKETVSLKNIKDAASTSSKATAFNKKYDEWKLAVDGLIAKEDFFEHHNKVKILSVLYSITGIAFIFLCMKSPLGVFVAAIDILAIIFAIIYFVAYKRRTTNGNDEYVKWMALKKFLLEFGNFSEKELPEIVLWEKYLVYATIFGIADKLEKTMRIKILEISTDTYDDFPLIIMATHNMRMLNQLTRVVNNSHNAALTKVSESINSGNRSSGGGFGGGFSGGGSIGGGFSGGGRGF